MYDEITKAELGITTNPYFARRAKEILLESIIALRSRPALESATINTVLHYSSHDVMHAVVTFLRKKENKIVVTVVDPNGITPDEIQTANTIKTYLESVNPDGKYVIEDLRCPMSKGGLQYLTGGQFLGLKEPGGYCATWATMFLIYSIGTDGATPDEVIGELMDMFTGRGPTILNILIRIVSRNMARLVQEQAHLDPELCAKDLICCDNHSYCEPLLDEDSIVWGNNQLSIPLNCMPEYFAIGKYLFTSANGMLWFESNGGYSMVGLKINPDPKAFDAYIKLLELAGEKVVSPRIKDVWRCGGKRAILNKEHVDIGAICFQFKWRPVMQLVGKEIIGKNLELDLFGFAKFGKENNLSFHRLLSSWDNIYSFEVPHPEKGVHIYLLDLDLAERGPTPEPTVVYKQYQEILK